MLICLCDKHKGYNIVEIELTSSHYPRHEAQDHQLLLLFSNKFLMSFFFKNLSWNLVALVRE